jgi:CDP-diglyceride synthetase
MEKRKPTYTQLGMLFGIFIGGGIGVLLFVFTQNPLYFTLVGIGLVIGLLIGAGMDRNQETHQDK